MQISRRGFANAIVAALGVVAAMLCVPYLVVLWVFGLGYEDYVFESIKIGDTEEKLLGLLKQHRIDYVRENAGERTF